ncbi:hypothetical protein N7474_008980 [Penicillium riverlandense]|uniref:uncharacterized protein n=1 Tax=Penicillium riverlandense TaxID=1903569 RepID=UPI0025494A4B|nr:uncharacterized protein N7474_008980 [Penicillium riverlandense]KAJ5812679.1 hypothetical protein N7474_008980 [Penicillium riverlandense]
MAIRMFQGLQAASDTALTSQGHASKTTQLRKMVWKREIQRRTIWACFIMDRTMSCGKDRPSSLDITAMKIHLPASEDDFDLGITPSESITYNQLIDLNSTDINGRLTIADYYTITIRSLDIWSHTCKWMADGGRRQVSALGACPWESGSTWYQIQTELDQWRDMLHVRLKYPETPLCIYVHRRQGERFAFVNLIYYLTYGEIWFSACSTDEC